MGEPLFVGEGELWEATRETKEISKFHFDYEMVLLYLHIALAVLTAMGPGTAGELQ